MQAIAVQSFFLFCRLVTLGTSLMIDRVFFGEVSCFKLSAKTFYFFSHFKDVLDFCNSHYLCLCLVYLP